MAKTRRYPVEVQVIFVIILVTLLLGVANGCGSTISRAGSTVRTRVTLNDETITSGSGMLAGMNDKLKIQSMSEAAAAYAHANKTMATIVALTKEASRGSISVNKRADKNREVERLREQYKREVEPLSAFFNEVEHKINKQ